MNPALTRKKKTGYAFGILMAGRLLTLYGCDASADAAGKESLVIINNIQLDFCAAL